ncbi:MAG: aspartate kinase, partial [Oscillospiraceae bacterium]|nr:aspartate kinase [Oscillospiraceae bacterium]
GFRTSRTFGAARIESIKTERIQSELDKRKIVIVAGFQGLNKSDDLTTLGRGGSDTSAVAIAAVLHADRCQIFTDVTGVFTADPRKVSGARKLEEITYDEMLELATLGAQVLNNRSVEMAKKYSVELEVLSSLVRESGTIVKEAVKMEKMIIRGVTKDTDVAQISVVGMKDIPGNAFKMFSKLASKKINIDVILQSIGRNGTKDISFTCSKEYAAAAVEILEEMFGVQGATITCNTSVAKVSVVGTGMQTHSGTASKMFGALYEAGINISMISTSEITISVLIEKELADQAVSAVHKAFFEQ